MPVRSPLINVMTRAAYRAARGLIRDFGEVENLQTSKKGPADFVSAADLRSEKILREELGKARPEFGFLLEESGEIPGKDGHHRWVVDPLDGTLNFLHGLPHFCISIALEQDGEAIAGLVYDPIHDELYWAERGAGAYLNDRRLRVSARRHLEDAVLATGLPHGLVDLHAPQARMVAGLTPRTAAIRRYGSAALDLCYVASGRFDGYWQMGLKRWDIAAGVVLVREAGGIVTRINGRPDVLDHRDILATNSNFHGAVQGILAEAAPDVDRLLAP